MHDCCIRVVHNRVTALLEYLDLLAVFPGAYVDNPVCDYSSRVRISIFAMQNTISYSSQTPFFLLFALASYFSKKLLAKIGAALIPCDRGPRGYVNAIGAGLGRINHFVRTYRPRPESCSEVAQELTMQAGT